jgi:pyridoxine kinase
VRFAGTGDVFTSALTGLLIKENDFPIAVRKAAEFTESCIDKTDDKSKSFYYGLAFEDCLSEL